MPRAPREQPAKPDTPPPPKLVEEKLEDPESAPQEARRPRQTQVSSAEGRVVEGQVPQIELFEPEPISDEDLEKLNVYQRWNRVLGEIGLVPKRGWNDHHKYWFTTDADLNAFIGPLFGKYHLVVIPSIILDQVQRIEPAPGSKQFLTRVPMKIRVLNADKPDDAFEVDWIGEGADTVDKGLYKAFTGGLKYFYMKQLQVATGDDPEVFTRTDQIGEMQATQAAQAGNGGGQRPPPQTRPSNRPQPQRGGRQDEVTEVQERQVRAMSHALGLGVRGVASFIDRVLETNIFETIDAMDNEEEARTALGAWIKSRKGTEIGKVLYEMGQETTRRAEVKPKEADPTDTVVTDGSAEAEAEVQATASQPPPGYEEEAAASEERSQQAADEYAGGYGG